MSEMQKKFNKMDRERLIEESSTLAIAKYKQSSTQDQQLMIGSGGYASKMPAMGDTAALITLTTGRVLDAVLGGVAGVLGGAAMGATSYGAAGIAGGLTGLATNESNVWFDSQGNFHQNNKPGQGGNAPNNNTNNNPNGTNSGNNPTSNNNSNNNNGQNNQRFNALEALVSTKEDVEYLKKIIRVIGDKMGINVDNPPNISRH